MKIWKLSVILFAVGVGMLTGFQSTAAAADEISQISAAELKKMIDNKETNFVVVDVQPKAVYDLGHIKGAVSFPWAANIKSTGSLPKDKLLVLYCDCPNEEDSTNTATQLKQKFGYSSVRVLKGGWSGWTKLNYPVEKK